MNLRPDQSVNNLRLSFSPTHVPANAPTNVPPNGAKPVDTLTNTPAAVVWD